MCGVRYFRIDDDFHLWQPMGRVGRRLSARRAGSTTTSDGRQQPDRPASRLEHELLRRLQVELLLQLDVRRVQQPHRESTSACGATRQARSTSRTARALNSHTDKDDVVVPRRAAARRLVRRDVQLASRAGLPRRGHHRHRQLGGPDPDRLHQRPVPGHDRLGRARSSSTACKSVPSAGTRKRVGQAVPDLNWSTSCQAQPDLQIDPAPRSVSSLLAGRGFFVRIDWSRLPTPTVVDCESRFHPMDELPRIRDSR